MTRRVYRAARGDLRGRNVVEIKEEWEELTVNQGRVICAWWGREGGRDRERVLKKIN